MRSTIRIDDALFAELRAHAARQGRPVTEVVEDAIRAVLAWAESPRRVKLTTFGGNGLRPGVDLDDSARFADVMDESEAAP